MPTMHEVESSTMRAIGYDEDRSELYIEFTSGELYAYSLVPRRIFRELFDADSKGQYFNRSIRNVYSYRKLT